MDESKIIDELVALLENIEASGEEMSAQEEQEILEIMQDILSSFSSVYEEEAPPEEVEIPESIPNAPVFSSPSGLLWILAGGNETAFVNYMRTFPDPALNEIARNPAQLQSLINQFKSTITQAHGEVAEGIPKAELNSSNIYGFTYDPKTQLLKVKFQGNDGYGDGPIYQYQGVPPQIFKIFKDGAIPAKTNGSNRFGSWWVGKRPSLGAAMFSLIKMGGYPYQKIG